MIFVDHQVFEADTVDGLGRSALMHATWARSAEAVVWLVHRKASLELLGVFGEVKQKVQKTGELR